MDVEGIILVLSCQKHRYTRLINLNLNKHSYNNWKVIKVIGKPFMKKEYELVDDILFIRCEDSYLHLLKKLALSLKYIYKLFNIKQGVLRCGDDLIFNENNLINITDKKLKNDKKNGILYTKIGNKYINNENLVTYNYIYISMPRKIEYENIKLIEIKPINNKIKVCITYDKVYENPIIEYDIESYNNLSLEEKLKKTVSLIPCT